LGKLTSDYDYDLFVIGAGSGGVRCARMSASMGARVAIAEERYYGGTCVNVGCVPKKLFYYGSHVSEELALAASYGWTVPPVEFDWNILRDNKTREIERLNGIYQRILTSNNVTVIDGHASLDGPNHVQVGGKTYSAKHILIATGSWPFMPEIPGIEHAITSNEFFYLDSLPERALIVGGGYIGIEFACILKNLGVDVSISYRGELFLRGFDIDVRHHVKSALEEKGITLLFNQDVVSIESENNGVRTVTDGEGKTRDYDLVIYATGRKPKTDGLGLEALKIKLTKSGAVEVNERYQSSVPSVYAIGDVIDRMQLTPVALAEGMFLSKHFFGEGAAPLNYDNIPTAVFTQPSIGTVGLSEDQAREQGYKLKIFKSEFAPMKYSFKEQKEKSFMKLVVDAKTDIVLGAHMVGPEAGEIIQGIGIAVNMGATKAQFDQTIGIHPTTAEEFVTMRTAELE